MHKERVSIVVPVYNTEKYLDACIQSVLNQTYEHWELILVNDGSVDNSENICRSYASNDERILVVSQENRGVSAARNAGIAKATGKYISFLDSDDELERNAIEILLDDIIQYGADISVATKSLVKADGTIQCLDNDGSVTVYEGEEMLERSLRYAKYTNSLHAQLFSVDFINGISFAEGYRINEDGYFLFVCYTQKPRVVQRKTNVYRYFYRENSSSNGKFSEKYFDMLYFSNQKVAYIQENIPHLLGEAKNMEARTHLLLLQVLCRTNDKQYKNAEKNSVKTVRKLYRYYQPINSHHKILAWIVLVGCYPLYKAVIRLKYFR